MTTATRPATLSSAEVCRQTGLSYWQLNFWAMNGYLVPSFVSKDGRPSEGGSGSDRRFTQAEVDVAAMMARLVLLGVTAGRAAAVARDPAQRWRWLAEVMAAAKGMP